MIKPPSQACPEKSVIRLKHHLYLTIAVDWDVKPQTKQNDWTVNVDADHPEHGQGNSRPS